MKKFILASLFVLTLAIFLSGCSQSSGAVQAVDSYYKAILSQNADQLKAVTCADFQEQAQVELDSFQGVKMELQGYSCKENGKDGEATLVKCDGKIVATYGSDSMDFPLSDRVHQVVNDGGNWKVCGY